jgi:hypothetical protein
MSRYTLWIIGLLALTSCGVDEPSTNEVNEAVKCQDCSPPPRRCEVDAQGVETGRCVIDDASNGVCAIGIRGVQGCVVGRQGTATHGTCFTFDQNSCTATGWIM